MKKIKAIWVAIIALMVGAGLYGYYILTTLGSNQESPTQSSPSLETAEASIGDITISVSGSGEVVPVTEFGLDIDESGTITEILVHPGDEVQAGDVLLRLQTSQTSTELAAEITAAKLAVVQAQAAVDDLYATAETETALALIELEDAQLALDDLMDLDVEKAEAAQSIAQAQEDIADAEMMLYIYQSSPSEDAVYTAYASYLFKQETLDRLEKQLAKSTKSLSRARDSSMRKRMETQIHQLEAQVANQRIVVENAEYRMETIDAEADPLDISVSEAQLATAQAQLAASQQALEELQAGPNPGDVATAEARLADAQAAWDRLKDGPNPQDVAMAETQLEKAQLELEILQQKTTQIDLVAPFDGVITAMNATIGERVTTDSSDQSDTSDNSTGTSFFDPFSSWNSSRSNASQSLITLADMSQPLLEIYLDETDFEQVAVGYPVEVTFDALDDQVFTGEIIEVHPQLETVNNTTALVAFVRLDNDSYDKPNSLLIGMTASIEVISGQTSGAVLVPIEALVQDDADTYVVYVIHDDQPVRREVTVGLMDFTTAEITAGLKAGEVVALEYQNTTGN
jgi:HlyD family secretion protein